MPTIRYYLPSSGTALTPAPARGTDWSSSNGTTLREMTITPGTSTNSSAPGQSSNLGVEWRQRTHEFVTPVLPAGIKVTAVRAAIRGEHWQGGNKALTLNMRLIGADYQTPSDVIVDMAKATVTTTAGISVRTISAVPNKIVPAGSRMHVELGGTLYAGTASGAAQYVEIGETGTDLPYTEGSTATGRGWVEIDYVAAPLAPGVNVIETFKYETSNGTGVQTLGTTAQPMQAGDVVVVFSTWFAGATSPVYGLGGTWRSYDHTFTTGPGSNTSSVPSMTMHVCRDATGAGAVQVNSGASSLRGAAYGFVLRSSTSSYISLFRRATASTTVNVTSLSATATRARAGDVALGVTSWVAASGSPSTSISPGGATSGTSQYDNSTYNETQALWRVVSGATEDLTLTSTRTTAARGAVSMVVATDNVQTPATPEVIPIVVSPVAASWNAMMSAFQFLPNDIVLVIEDVAFSTGSTYTESVPSGLGATWTKMVLSAGNPRRVIVHVGRGATTPGLVAISGGSNPAINQGQVEVLVVRGLPTTVVKHEGSYADVTGTTHTGPAILANTGEIVLSHAIKQSASGDITDVLAVKQPPSGWSTVQPRGSVGGAAWSSYRIATGAGETHQTGFTSATNTDTGISMLRIGVQVERITGSISAISGMQVTLTTPTRPLAVRMDSTWGPNLFDDPTGKDLIDDGSSVVGWSSPTSAVSAASGYVSANASEAWSNRAVLERTGPVTVVSNLWDRIEVYWTVGGNANPSLFAYATRNGSEGSLTHVLTEMTGVGQQRRSIFSFSFDGTFSSIRFQAEGFSGFGEGYGLFIDSLYRSPSPYARQTAWDPDFYSGLDDAEQFVEVVGGPSDTAVMIERAANEVQPMLLYPRWLTPGDLSHPIRVSRWTRVVAAKGGSATATSGVEVNTDQGRRSGAPLLRQDGTPVPTRTVVPADGWQWHDDEGTTFYQVYNEYFVISATTVWSLTATNPDVVNVFDGGSAAGWTATEQPYNGSQVSTQIQVFDPWGSLGSLLMFGDSNGTFTTLRANRSGAIPAPSGKTHLAVEVYVDDNSGYDASLLIDSLHTKTPVQVVPAREGGSLFIFDLTDRPIASSLQLQIVAASTMYRAGVADISWVPWPLRPARLYVSDIEVREKLADRAPLQVTFEPRRIVGLSMGGTSSLTIIFPTDWKIDGAESDLLVTLTRAMQETLAATSDLSINLRPRPTVLAAISDLQVVLSGVISLTIDAISDLEVTLSYPPLPTDTTNRVGGRHRGGYGVATWEPAIVPRPQSVYGSAPVREDLLYMVAAAFGSVTMEGTQPKYTVSAAHAPRARQRILVGGKDITYFRDKVTPDVGYQHAEPLLHGPGQLSLPQVSAAFEKPGVGALKWLKPGKPVIVQRVLDGVVVDEDYKGVIIAWEPDSNGGLSVELGGEAAGRAGLIDKQLPIFRDVLDIGRLAWRAIKDLGLPFQPRMGPVTGIESATWGGMAHLDYIAELVTKGWTRSGAQWTIMPDSQGVYRMQRKDLETVHLTVFTDETRNVARLRRDIAEEPNRIFMSGVTPAGQRVRFGAYPGLKQGRRAPYPFADNRNFGPGTTNEMTDNGDGISILVNRLWVTGFLSLADYPGGYDGDVAKAVAALKDRAGIETGFFGPSETVMTPATWRALWDLDATGYSLRGSAIQPAAQRSYTRRYRRSGSGAIIGKNKKYDKHRLPVDATYDAGTGHRRGQMREWAETELVREENYYGTITLKTGAVLAGLVAKGATVTPDMLRDTRWIRPGMNAWLPMHAGGLLVHVSGVDVASDTVTLTVDTQARDAAKVWEVINRNKEARNDPARRWRGNRASTEIKDSIDVWDEVGGTLDNDVDLVAGWNVIKVVAGQAGTISRIRLIVQTVTGGEVISIDGKEYACAVFGDKVTVRKLQHLVPAPLTAAGTKRWQNKRVSKSLRKLGLLYAAGTSEEPCGYSPGRKHTKEREVEQPNPDYNPDTDPDSDKVITTTVSESWGTVTGMHDDDAGFGYNRYGAEPVLFLAIWVADDTTLKGGQVMWNQLESGA